MESEANLQATVFFGHFQTAFWWNIQQQQEQTVDGNK